MSAMDRQRCDRIYHEAIGDVDAFERMMVNATFESYRDAPDAAAMLYVPEEIPFGASDIRRGMLERRVGEDIVPFGGWREPAYAIRKSDGAKTAHFSIYHLGEPADFVISAVPDEEAAPRFAEFRQDLFDEVEMMLGFMQQRRADPSAPLHMLYKHVKATVDSSIPQSARFEVYDSDWVSLWKRDLFVSQANLIEEWLDTREHQVPDDKGIPTLRSRLRANRLRRNDA
jgi:hypothetical protein